MKLKLCRDNGPLWAIKDQQCPYRVYPEGTNLVKNPSIINPRTEGWTWKGDKGLMYAIHQIAAFESNFPDLKMQPGDAPIEIELEIRRV